MLCGCLLIPSAEAQGYRKQKSKSVPHYGLSGLSVSVDAGLLIPSDKQANFYCGRDGNPNTISRVLYTNSYGQEIWQNLYSQGLITDAVPNYRALKVEEYAEMSYRLTYQIGLGFRYDYDGGWGWLFRFDYSRVQAIGAFNLSSNNGQGVISDRGRYVRCGMFGVENRIFIDLALCKRFSLGDHWELEADLGFNLNNVKIKEHKMEIGGRYYDILDRWNGNSPNMGVGSYEYINQGAVGIGGFGTLALSYIVSGVGSIDLGYTCYYTQIRYRSYNEGNAYAPQHTIFLRFNLGNFNFFK